MRDPEGSQSHPLRIHHADELRHCLLQTPGCCLWHAEAQPCCPMALWEAGGTWVLWVLPSPCKHPGQTLLCLQVPGCCGDGDHGDSMFPAPMVTPGTFPTVVPAGRGGQWGHALPRPASPHQSETGEPLPLPQPIRAQGPSSSQPIPGGGGAEGSTAASPPANQRPAVPVGEGGAGPHGGRGTALEARPALGEGLQVQGCAVGACGQDVGNVLPQESGPVDAPAGRCEPIGHPGETAPPGCPPKMGESTTPLSIPTSPSLLLLCGWQDLLWALAIPAAGRAAL